MQRSHSFALGASRAQDDSGVADEADQVLHATKLFAPQRPAPRDASVPPASPQPPAPQSRFLRRARSFSLSALSPSSPSMGPSAAPMPPPPPLVAEVIPARPDARTLGVLGLAAHHMVSAGLGLFKGLQSVAGENDVLAFGEAHTIGRRPYMEDRFCAELCLTQQPVNQSLFGVFDGHGGKRAAQFCSDNIPAQIKAHPSLLDRPEAALRDAFEKVDRDFCNMASARFLDDGTTAVVVLIRGRTVWCANAGDSRCVLSRNALAVPLSEDHKPDLPAERQRIVGAGGFVKHLGVWRVMGVLAVSRAIGDLSLKRFVPATPDVVKTELGDQDEFLVLASDGLWDVMSNQDAVDLLHTRPQLLLKPDQAAKALVAEAYRRGSFDNVTALVVLLRLPSLVKSREKARSNLESMEEAMEEALEEAAAAAEAEAQAQAQPQAQADAGAGKQEAEEASHGSGRRRKHKHKSKSKS